MFKTSLTIISKPKPKCSQLAELHKVDDYLGPVLAAFFCCVFNLVGHAEKHCLQGTLKTYQ